MPPVTNPAAPAEAAGRFPRAGIPRLTIAPRFRGPSGSGNGGYVCGRIAGYLDGPVTVTLRRPPPLATALAVERDGGPGGGPGGEATLRVLDGRTLVAEAAAAPGPAALAIPDPVSMAQARAAAGGARYFQDPVFPDCFVCGTNRRPGDGLRIFPGPVPGRALWAAPWTPDRSVAGADGCVLPEMAWAALDCPGGIAVAEDAGLGPDTAIVLGQMTASLAALPAPGDECLVVAWPGGGAGRKLTAGSALLAPGGQVLAVAWAVWLTVPRPARVAPAGGAA
jgi:hypothetical protein